MTGRECDLTGGSGASEVNLDSQQFVLQFARNNSDGRQIVANPWNYCVGGHCTSV